MPSGSGVIEYKFYPFHMTSADLRTPGPLEEPVCSPQTSPAGSAGSELARSS
jgi:hypothetical protein